MRVCCAKGPQARSQCSTPACSAALYQQQTSPLQLALLVMNTSSRRSPLSATALQASARAAGAA